MMHDSCYIARGAFMGTSLVNYVPTTSQETETVNATGAPMLCQENVKIKCFKTLKPRPLAGAAF